MTEYIITETDFKEDIIDFINYVFSQSRKPHDFKTLVPKSYADDAQGLGAVHYIAKKGGKIKAVVATRIIDVAANGKLLKYGLIGNVSVHPYSRGEGHMKTLLNMAIEDAQKRNVDVLVLAGQRQRYGYFGFENAGSNLCFDVSDSNIRHCFKDIDCSDIVFIPMQDAPSQDIDKALELYETKVFHSIRPRDEFPIIMRTWNAPCNFIYKNGQMIGYIFGMHHEVILRDEQDYPQVLKALFEHAKPEEIKITVHPYEKKRAEFLSGICECTGIVTCEMIRVLNWEKTLDSFLRLKATYTPLDDGLCEILIGNQGFSVSVKDNNPSVKKVAVSEKAIKMSDSEALQKFFDIPSIMFSDKKFNNWLPLPFVIDAADSY